MGGMIAKNCATYPKRFKSVAFMSTRCGSEMDWPSVVEDQISIMSYLNFRFKHAYMERWQRGDDAKSKLREKHRNCHELPESIIYGV
ncbi:hypothetical protein H4Q26_007772 [Puccinia striiformis f. sp. tritici PST-130]|nr:hypothetical protein H4Q26_007772 [Puccinia striiformis f. sp. tritici PST-130]